MRILFHLIGVAAGLMVLSCKPAPDRFDLAEFRHPSATYRSMSFWSLNDSLSADEMRWQLALFNIPPSRRPYSRGLKVESDGGIEAIAEDRAPLAGYPQRTDHGLAGIFQAYAPDGQGLEKAPPII